MVVNLYYGWVPAFVTICNFSTLATCYAEHGGHVRPEAEL